MNDVERDAKLSDDEVYRYWLTRSWPEGIGSVLWVMLNPSTADGYKDDATIRRIVGFTRSWGYRQAVVCNLFALRSTNPQMLTRHDDPIGPDNDRWLNHFAECSADAVCAWGAHRMAGERASKVVPLLQRRTALHCLGRTRAGAPCHPLRLANATPLQLWGAGVT